VAGACAATRSAVSSARREQSLKSSETNRRSIVGALDSVGEQHYRETKRRRSAPRVAAIARLTRQLALARRGRLALAVALEPALEVPDALTQPPAQLRDLAGAE